MTYLQKDRFLPQKSYRAGKDFHTPSGYKRPVEGPKGCYGIDAVRNEKPPGATWFINNLRNLPFFLLLFSVL